MARAAKRTREALPGEASDNDASRRGGLVPDDIISVVRQIGPTLSPSEQRVATSVLADVDYAVHASNGDLARRAGVSEPTVTRFSRSVGCRGVRELKVRLAQAMAVGRIYLELPPHVGTDLARPALWQSVFQEIRRAITAVEQQLRKEDVEKAAEAIANCSKLAPAPLRSLMKSTRAVPVAVLLPSSSRRSRRPCGTTVGAFARAQAFNSATENV